MKKYKIYAKGNYIVVYDAMKMEYFYGHKKEVFVDRSNKGVNSYSIYNIKDFKDSDTLHLEDLLKENDTPYTKDSWELFYLENTGNFNGGGSTPTINQTALDLKLESGDNVSELVNDAGYLTEETVTSLSLSANILTYLDEDGVETNLDLSLYLDDTNLARLVNGVLDNETGIITFTRDDDTTFTIDFSSLFSGHLKSGDNISELVNDAGYIDSFIEEDPIFTSSEAFNFVVGDKDNLDNQSGINTGDETTASIQAKRPLKTIENQSLEGIGNIDLSKSDIGLGNVDNTSDLNKPISTTTQSALDLKAPLASPTFTGTVSGITKGMVGLANVDNTSDVNKPISTATQTALNLKLNIGGNVGDLINNVGYITTAPFGNSYSKEFSSYVDTSTSTAVFNISSASFASINNISISTELIGGTVHNSPFGVVTAKSLTSITVSLFDSQTTGVLIGGSITGLEDHATADTRVYITVKGT